MAIIFRTSDPAKWGAGKGSNLSPQEVDNNFFEIVQQIESLLANLPQPAEISNIEVIGTQMMIYLSNGDHYGPYTLPYVVYRYRGEWKPNETYSFLDMVTVKQRGLYFVNINHTSDAAFDPDRTINGNPVYTLMFGESAYIYDIGFFYPMRPGQGIGAGGYMAAHLLLRAITLPSGLPGSAAKLRIAPAADLSFAIKDQDGSSLGILTFSAGETDGVFTFNDDWQGEPGDYLYLAPPDALDDAARDLMVTLSAIRMA